MLPTAFVSWPMILAVVFAFSGFGKRGDDDNASARDWSDLGVPDALNVRWLRRSHAWAELVLAAGLVVAPGVLAIVTAAGAAVLCLVYLVLVVRAAARPEPADCACFGEGSRAAITGQTVVRNVVLLALAVLSLAHAIVYGSPLSVLMLTPASSWWWLLAVAVAGATAYLMAPQTSAAANPAPVGTAPDGATGEPLGGQGEYLRTLTPLANLADRDGLVYSIVDLSRARAQLLIFVNPGCGSCLTVVGRVPQWQAQLPELQIRLVVTQDLDQLEASWPEWVPYAMQDLNGEASRMLRVINTPTAVLLGTDGMLAGGPITGSGDIIAFMDDVTATFEQARNAGELIHAG